MAPSFAARATPYATNNHKHALLGVRGAHMLATDGYYTTQECASRLACPKRWSQTLVSNAGLIRWPERPSQWPTTTLRVRTRSRRNTMPSVSPIGCCGSRGSSRGQRRYLPLLVLAQIRWGGNSRTEIRNMVSSFCVCVCVCVWKFFMRFLVFLLFLSDILRDKDSLSIMRGVSSTPAVGACRRLEHQHDCQ